MLWSLDKIRTIWEEFDNLSIVLADTIHCYDGMHILDSLCDLFMF